MFVSEPLCSLALFLLCTSWHRPGSLIKSLKMILTILKDHAFNPNMTLLVTTLFSPFLNLI